VNKFAPLKYVSDAFEERQAELLEMFQTDDDENIYYLPRQDLDSDEAYQQALQEELEVLDYYRGANVLEAIERSNDKLKGILGHVYEYEFRLESSNLKKLRDTLLSKLLSGELSVPDAENKPTQAESASSAACKAL